MGVIDIPLSDREFDVLQLVAEGHTNRAIGRRLGIAEKTVQHHVANILLKMDARNRAHAVHKMWLLSMDWAVAEYGDSSAEPDIAIILGPE